MPVHNRGFKDKDGNPVPAGLMQEGPILNVQIGVPESLANHLEQQGEVIPSPVSGMCLIDTGATNTAVDRGLVEQLGVKPHDRAQIGTGAGQTDQPIFQLHLEFPQEGFGFETSRAIGVDLTGQQVAGGHPLIALLGRDVLQNFVLIYNGPDGRFTLAM